MSDTTEIEFFVMVDQDGDYAVHTDESELGQAYADTILDTPPNASRVFHFKLTVPLPRATEVVATIPDKGDEPVNIAIS